MDSGGSSVEETTVLLFGPQALSFREDSLERLRQFLTTNSDGTWMRKVITELPNFIKNLSEQFPKLQATPAVKLLGELDDWLDSDSATPPFATRKLPNALLTPLVVLEQLVQYTQYVSWSHVDTGLGSDQYGPQPRRSTTVGFCTGLLTALAVSSSSSQEEFQRYAAVSVRLAALVGTLVDAEEVLGQHGISKTYSTACNSREQKTRLENILQESPEVRR